MDRERASPVPAPSARDVSLPQPPRRVGTEPRTQMSPGATVLLVSCSPCGQGPALGVAGAQPGAPCFC